jgi:hypothetical protein
VTDPEIKNLLGRALGDEPPLGIDRDEVLRHGRKRLRTRRMFEAGGVVTAVVVAAVGAALLTGVVGERETLPPAASTTVEQPAPPGPTLPLTPPPTTGTTAQPPSSMPGYPPSNDRASQLSDVLLTAGALKVGEMTSFPGKSLAFVVADSNYVFEADLRIGQVEGSVLVSVSPALPADGGAKCDSIPEPKSDCATQIVGGQPVSVATWRDKNTGEKRYLGHAVKADGSTVSVIATNLSERQRDSGKRPTTWTPVIDRDTVANLAALPGLTFT